jgi:hypothetical protein
MDVQFLTFGLFGYLFSLLQIIIIIFIGDEDVDKMFTSFPNDDIVFALLLPLKMVVEIFLIFFLASYTEVSTDAIVNEVAGPALRWAGLILLLLGLNMWPFLTFYWMKMKVEAWGVWGSLILLFVGSSLLTVSILFQVMIPASMNGDDSSLIVLSIVAFILSIGNMVWYAIIDLWKWGGTFLVKENQRIGRAGFNATLTTSEIERLAGANGYIESVPLNNEDIIASI